MNSTFNDDTRARRIGKAMIRPAWTPITIAMMIMGFMVFWPLGLAMIAYILWGERLDEFKSTVNDQTNRFTKGWSRDCGSSRRQASRSGNVAFDEWRDAEIERLREERRKLEEMRADFEDHMQEMRRAKDGKEFDEFMARYKRNTAASDEGSNRKPGKKSVPDI